MQVVHQKLLEDGHYIQSVFVDYPEVGERSPWASKVLGFKFQIAGFRGLGFRGLGFRRLGLKVLGFGGLGFRGVGLQDLEGLGLGIYVLRL